MAQVRRAEASWQGDLFTGSGTVSAVTSGTISSLPITWKARAEANDTGMTSPEELLAAAHASCYARALTSRLAKNGTPASKLSVKVAVLFDKGDAGWGIASSAITVRGEVPGIDGAKFTELAEDAKSNCPVSRALTGNVALSLDASLA